MSNPEPEEIANVPFAVPPATGGGKPAFWPVVTSAKEGMLVSYMGSNGKLIGNESRMFHANRPDGANPRFHAGIDLFANTGDVVVSCEDGAIVDFYQFLPSHGEVTFALIVQNDSGQVINYGEVAGTSLNAFGLFVGAPVAAGQKIATIGATGMLHFEMYRRNTIHNEVWFQTDSAPADLLNPTKYLLALASGVAPSQPPTPGENGNPAKPAPVIAQFVRAVAVAPAGSEARHVNYFDANNCQQTKSEGSRSWRNNNPGNIVCGQFVSGHGAIGCDSNTQPTAGIFPSLDSGRDAQISLLRTKGYMSLTVGDALTKWTGSNNPGYRKVVGDHSNIAMDRVINSLSDEEIEALCEGMQVAEGFNEGTVSALICPEGGGGEVV